jgi:signal transduction histidine kinase
MAKVGFDSDTKGVETVMAILKASDLKTGKTAFIKEKANISALVAEIIESKKDSAIQKGLELTFEIEPNIETQVDQLQIKEVFKNLLTNSILYTPTGTVHVVLKRENGKVKFSVVDTGVGLSEQDKAKLFTEGGKGEESSLVNVDSTGYGLYIARQIVEQHGGIIEAHSEGRGKGSEFFVLLPDSK